MLRGAHRVADARVPAQGPYDHPWHGHPVVFSGSLESVAPRLVRVDAVQPQGVPLAGTVGALGGAGRVGNPRGAPRGVPGGHRGWRGGRGAGTYPVSAALVPGPRLWGGRQLGGAPRLGDLLLWEGGAVLGADLEEG